MTPVGYGTATPEAVAAVVAARYATGPVTECRLLHRGFNDIYAVHTARRRYVFRVSGLRPRGPADVAEEVAFLDHLAAAGVPVAQAMTMADGARVLTMDMPEGPRPAALFEDAGGRPPGLDSPDDARAQGATLARLHTAAESYAGRSAYTLNADHLLHRPLSAVLALGLATPEAQARLEALANRLLARLARVAPCLTRIRCHGDCHGLNARILTEGPRAGQAVFFDFDDGGAGFLAYDLAVHLWAQTSFGRRRHAIWHAFLAGYRGYRALRPEDLDAIELFVPFRHVWLLGEYAAQTSRWGSEVLSAALIERETAFLVEWERERVDPGLLGGSARDIQRDTGTGSPGQARG